MLKYFCKNFLKNLLKVLGVLAAVSAMIGIGWAIAEYGLPVILILGFIVLLIVSYSNALEEVKREKASKHYEDIRSLSHRYRALADAIMNKAPISNQRKDLEDELVYYRELYGEKDEDYQFYLEAYRTLTNKNFE